MTTPTTRRNSAPPRQRPTPPTTAARRRASAPPALGRPGTQPVAAGGAPPPPPPPPAGGTVTTDDSPPITLTLLHRADTEVKGAGTGPGGAASPPPPPPPQKTKRGDLPKAPAPAKKDTPWNQLLLLGQQAVHTSGEAARTAMMQTASAIVRSCIASCTVELEPTRRVFHMLHVTQMQGLTDRERRQLLNELITGLFQSGGTAEIVLQDAAFVTKLITLLTGVPDEVMTKEVRYGLIRMLVEGLLASNGLAKVVAEQPKVMCTLLLLTDAMTGDPQLVAGLKLDQDGHLRGTLAKLGPQALPVACAFITHHWNGTAKDLGNLFQWIFRTITTSAWNDRGTELAARGLNLLWISGEFGMICDLIRNGVDCTLAAKAWDGTKREGVWTGYVQPMTHLLGKYVKLVADLDAKRPVPEAKRARVEGAKDIIAAIDSLPKQKRPDIVLHWSTIAGCLMVKGFAGKPGTIWGFEDVRLPYVQAARELTGAGQQPLRMLDMWAVVEQAFDKDEVRKLVANPEATIAGFLTKGFATVEDGVKQNLDQYGGIIPAQYKKAYMEMCGSYMRYLATRPEFIKYFDQTIITGKNLSKLLPTFACRMGLWWSLHEGKHVYYCLDGINMQDAVDYQKLKTLEINAYLAAADKTPAELLTLKPFQDVVTLAEVREVLRNWRRFRTMTTLVNQGTPMSQQDADAWAQKWFLQMLDARHSTMPREWRGDQFGMVLDEILRDESFWVWVGKKDQLQCLREARLLALAATGSFDVLYSALLLSCPRLTAYGLLPWSLVGRIDALVAATDETSRQEQLDKLYQAVAYACPVLRELLVVAFTRLHGAPSAAVKESFETEIWPDLHAIAEGRDPYVTPPVSTGPNIVDVTENLPTVTVIVEDAPTVQDADDNSPAPVPTPPASPTPLPSEKKPDAT